ncbi:MAG: hypothetical protein HPM95_21575, partial [Alphaproteobacteria bacterium]|nr:hypothetical protein [Alphaproteobacteria bacterium]
MFFRDEIVLANGQVKRLRHSVLGDRPGQADFMNAGLLEPFEGDAVPVAARTEQARFGRIKGKLCLDPLIEDLEIEFPGKPRAAQNGLVRTRLREAFVIGHGRAGRAGPCEEILDRIDGGIGKGGRCGGAEDEGQDGSAGSGGSGETRCHCQNPLFIGR